MPLVLRPFGDEEQGYSFHASAICSPIIRLKATEKASKNRIREHPVPNWDKKICILQIVQVQLCTVVESCTFTGS